MIQDIATTVSNLKSDKCDVSYIVTFAKPCCESHCKDCRRGIFINAGVDCFNDNADTADIMMCKTINAIKNHKRNMKFDGLHICHLDCKGVLVLCT